MSDHHIAPDDEADEISKRIEELEVMLLALQQATESLDLFLKLPGQPTRSALRYRSQ